MKMYIEINYLAELFERVYDKLNRLNIKRNDLIIDMIISDVEEIEKLTK